MGEYVDEKIANEAAKNGTLLGKTEPMRETKYTWWKVYKTSDSIIACVCDDNGISCGEKISPDEMEMYIDDPKGALDRYWGSKIDQPARLE